MIVAQLRDLADIVGASRLSRRCVSHLTDENHQN